MAGRDRGVRLGAVAALMIFGVTAWLAERGYTMPADLEMRASIHRWASPALTAAMQAVSVLGSGWFLAPLAVVPVWRWERRGERFEAYLFVAGSLSAEAVSELLKMLFHRPRPEVFFGLAPAHNYSFPSGHAFASTVYFGLLAALLPVGTWWRAAVILIMALIGISRVYLGYHYPSDVLGGWALAASWLAVCAMAAGYRSPSRRPGVP